MINKGEHVDFESLSDFIDGDIDRNAGDAISTHLEACQVCSVHYNDLRKLLSAADDLPRSVLPPDDMWPSLRATLNSRKDAVLPVAVPDRRSTSTRRFSWKVATVLAAAAIVLMALSSGITVLVLKQDRRDQIARQPTELRAPQNRDASPLALASFQQTENEFTRTIAELKQAVDTQRGSLSPETVRTVDHSLAVVDSAIAEARAALLADPNNRMLVDLLSASYQRKLDLLRRTSELGSKT